jgi:polar amino acid transport system substrate-binding protein
MKRNYLIILFLILSLFLSSVSLFGKEIEVVLSTDDTPGYPYIIGEGKDYDWIKPGIEIELYQRMAKMLDLKIKFIRRPWARCLNDLEVGEVDGIFPASFKEKRLKMGQYPMKNGKVDESKKTRDNTYYFYKLKDSPVNWDGKNFKYLTKSVGATRGWAIVDNLKKMGVKVEETNSPEQDLEKMLVGRIDGAASLETVMDVYLKSNKERYKNIIKVPIPLRKKPYYLMLSHQFVNKHPKLSQKMWNTIAEIRKSQWFIDIFKKYME